MQATNDELERALKWDRDVKLYGELKNELFPLSSYSVYKVLNKLEEIDIDELLKSNLVSSILTARDNITTKEWEEIYEEIYNYIPNVKSVDERVQYLYRIGLGYITKNLSWQTQKMIEDVKTEIEKFEYPPGSKAWALAKKAVLELYVYGEERYLKTIQEAENYWNEEEGIKRRVIAASEIYSAYWIPGHFDEALKIKASCCYWESRVDALITAKME